MVVFIEVTAGDTLTLTLITRVLVSVVKFHASRSTWNLRVPEVTGKDAPALARVRLDLKSV